MLRAVKPCAPVTRGVRKTIRVKKLLLYPGAVAVISGVLAYIFQQVQKWRAVSALLESEINRLLTSAKEDLDFLDRPLTTGLRLVIL